MDDMHQRMGEPVPCLDVLSHSDPSLPAHPAVGDTSRLEPLYLGIVERAATGMIIVDRGGAILWCNLAAQGVLEEADGLLRRGDLLAAVRSNEKALLQKAISHAITAHADALTAHLPPQLLQISRRDHLPLMLEVTPARAFASASDARLHETAQAAAAVILIADPEASLGESIRRVCKLYGFTLAETRVAELLTDGLTPAEIAEAMSIKLATVRAYLKQIFFKTGVNRQPMLMRLLLMTGIPLNIKN